MLGLYGFDIHEVFTGKAPIRVALAYLSRLAFEPMSLWRANQLGGPEHLGWDTHAYLMADQIDAIQVNTVVAGNVGASRAPRMPDPVFRPKVISNEEVIAKAESLADFDVNRLAMMTGEG